jgi:signal transduction histidine kinase
MAGEAASGYPLATLPVALEPGRALPRGSAAGRAAVWTFSIAGLAVGAAVLAIGVVLRAALVNADRRARFVTGVTHELRTPLTALRLSSDLAAGAAARGDGAKAVELAERTREQARRLERIVASVLAYARASGPRGRAAARSIRSVLDDALPGVQALAREGGVELSLDLDEQALGLGVRLDPQDLERILSNLVENAGRYGRPAGLAPGALVPAAVTLRALARGRGVGVGVRDRGPGVARRDRGRIFTAFEPGRAEGRGLGVGLGLALSRELARRSGARLRLREGSDGAWFEVVAPAVGTGVGELVEGDGVRR